MEATNVFVQEAFILMALVLSVLRIVHKVQGGYSRTILKYYLLVLNSLIIKELHFSSISHFNPTKKFLMTNLLGT